jgi:spoIIIJ-associated protein
MRYEGKSESDAVSTAARALARPEDQIRYRVVRDERSFWGGRVVEIEVDDGKEMPEPVSGLEPSVPPVVERPPGPAASRESRIEGSEGAGRESGPDLELSLPPVAERSPRLTAPDGAMDEEAFALVEATLTELLSAAGFLVEVRRREAAEMLFELIGDDVEPLLANKGEGLSGLEVLTGRIAGKRLGRPVYPRLDAEGFRAYQRETLEDLARRSAEEVKRTRRPQLLPPLPPGERRLVHLALAQDPEVETESEGEGFLKRVAVRPRAG